MAKVKKFKLVGLLKGVEVSSGTKKTGDPWERASLTIEKSDGRTKKVATFDTNDIKAANSANGKEIEIQYSKSKDGQYNNLENGTIKIMGKGEAPVDDEEEIVDEEEEVIEEESPDEKYNVKDMSVSKTPETATTPNQKPKMYSEDYWREKFNFEKENYHKTQSSIIRQNSWTQAMKYLESSLKAVELGIILKKDFTKKEMTIEQMKKIAHMIEEDIVRICCEEQK